MQQDNDPIKGVNDPIKGVNDPIKGVNDPIKGVNDPIKGVKQRSYDETPFKKASSDNIPLTISSPCLVYFPSISKKSKLRVDKGMLLSKGTDKGVGSLSL